MGQFVFGSGAFFLKLSTGDHYVRVGVAALQEVTINLGEVDIKELYGANRYPVDIRTGKGKITGGAKHADWRADLLSLILGIAAADQATGQRGLQLGEDGVVTGASVTVAPGAGNTYAEDVQVMFVDAGTGTSTLNAGDVLANNVGVAAGQYSVDPATGIYTFNAAEEGANVKITYIYTSTSGKKLTWRNVNIGTTPVCGGIFRGIRDDKQILLELLNVVPYGAKSGSKIDDWMMLDHSFSAFADANSDIIGYISVPQ